MIGFQEIGCHNAFDIKMDFTRKARFCARGHTTDTPMAMTYSSVVSRDSVRIGFMLAALNGLDVMACDLENAYLNAPCVEKIWFKGELECGSDKGKVCVVVSALYSLKSVGASWCATLAQALRDIGFVSIIADLMFGFDLRLTKMDTNTMKRCLCMLTMSWQPHMNQKY
jgi:hypothetical protein